MKFGGTETGIQHVMTQQVRLPEIFHESWQTGQSIQHEATGEGRAAWEKRIAWAKRRTAVRRAAGENARHEGGEGNTESVGSVEIITPAEEAYLRWLEEWTAHIEKIRVRIENGTYRVNTATLAEDMLRTVFREPRASDKM